MLHQSGVNKVVEWSDNKALEINTNTTEESVSGPPPDSHQVPIVVHNEKIKQVSLNKYLGVTDGLFSWDDRVEFFLQKDKTKDLFSLMF